MALKQQIHREHYTSYHKVEGNMSVMYSNLNVTVKYNFLKIY